MSAISGQVKTKSATSHATFQAAKSKYSSHYTEVFKALFKQMDTWKQGPDRITWSCGYQTSKYTVDVSIRASELLQITTSDPLTPEGRDHLVRILKSSPLPQYRIDVYVEKYALKTEDRKEPTKK